MGQKAIEAYIQKVMSLREQEQVLSTQYLENLAREVGLDEEDLQRVRSLVEQLYTQALSFIEFGNIEDALKNLEQIVVLAPNHFEAYYLLATCYYEKGKQSTHNHDLNKAKGYLQQCLQIQPTNTRVIALLSKIKAAEKRYQKKSMWLFLGIIVLSAVVFYFVSQEAQKPSLSEEQGSPLNTQESNSSTSEENSGSVKPNNSIALELVESPAGEGLRFITYKQEYNRYEGQKAYSVRIEGYLQLTDIEINELTLQLEALNAQGEVLEVRTQAVHRRSDQILRAGDMIPVSILIYKDKLSGFPEITKARLSYQNIQISSVPGISYAPSPEQPFAWGIKKPENYDFKLALRHANILENEFTGGKSYYTLVFEITNTGNLPIQTLVLNYKWKNQSGAVVHQQESYAVSSSLPPLRRGQKFVVKGTYALEMSAKNLQAPEVSVVRIE